MKALEDAVLDGKLSYGDALQFFSRSIIAAVLKYYNGNMTKTAKALGVKRQSLSMMIHRRMTPGRIFSPLRKPRPRKTIPVEVACDECRAPICVCELVEEVLGSRIV